MEQVTPPQTPRRRTRRRHSASGREFIATIVFALILVLGPLAFGAVDRLAQVMLVALLAVGVWACPPTLAPLGRWGNRLVVALLLLVVLKEFLPAGLFGGTAWRTELTRNFGLQLPLTHNPEPARVFDTVFALIVAVVWFVWVRTLATGHDERHTLSWCLFLSVTIVAATSFATRGIDSEAIYGLRFTPDWKGFGPFPNRNHSADLFAMGGVLGLGCAAWAWVRRKRPLFAIATVLTGLLVAALLETESRGGLVSFTAGIAIFIGLAFVKFRSRTVIFSGLATLLVVGSLTAAFGSTVLTRFQSPHAGLVSTQTRVAVWHDALAMWRDAPLFGHGLDAFTRVFPMYQKLDLEEIVVLHPESSWLQWLTELGLIPVALGVVALVLFVKPHIKAAFVRNQSFYLRASAFTAVGVLLFHSVFDVPAHRWGTAGFALAALALACPAAERAASTAHSRRVALVLVAIAGLWAAPFLFAGPAWSPLHLTQLVARDAVGGDVRTVEFEKSLRWFPLDPWLHHGLANRQLRVDGRAKAAEWQKHFAIASRLVPNSWTMPAAQARACRQLAPDLAIGYWQQAVDRGRGHRDEILGTALLETAKSPLASSSWGRYAEGNPEVLLSYAARLPEDQARYFYGLWWAQRGLQATLTESEVTSFYAQAFRLGTREQFDEWMKHHTALEVRDHRRWAAILHQWGDDARAWEMLTRRIPEPQFPPGVVSVPRIQLEAKWRLAPENHVNAQQLVQLLDYDGETAQSDEVVVAVATQVKTPPPPWFTRKAAYILSRGGYQAEAVTMLLASK